MRKAIDMKVTKKKLQQIVREEKQKLLEATLPDAYEEGMTGQSEQAEERLKDAFDEYVMILDEEMGYDVPMQLLKDSVMKLMHGWFADLETAASTEE